MLRAQEWKRCIEDAPIERLSLSISTTLLLIKAAVRSFVSLCEFLCHL